MQVIMHRQERGPVLVRDKQGWKARCCTLVVQ